MLAMITMSYTAGAIGVGFMVLLAVAIGHRAVKVIVNQRAGPLTNASKTTPAAKKPNRGPDGRFC